MAQILTTKELSRYLRLHQITISKYASAGVIPGFRIGHDWRFDKDAIDNWMSTGVDGAVTNNRPLKKGIKGQSGKKKARK